MYRRLTVTVLYLYCWYMDS